MAKSIYYILYCSQLVVMVIALIFSLKIKKLKETPQYMKNFYWYPAIGVAVGIPHFLATFFYLSVPFTMVLTNLSLVFHFSFLSLFISHVLKNSRIKIALKNSFYMCVALIFLFLIKQDLFEIGNRAFTISCLVLVLFCVVYYYELFKLPPILDLKKTPSFWIVTGIFFGMCLQAPINAVIFYLQDNIAISDFAIFVNIIILSYLIMYSFFIKAMIICIPHQNKI
jgi:hypothetical protein